MRSTRSAAEMPQRAKVGAAEPTEGLADGLGVGVRVGAEVGPAETVGAGVSEVGAALMLGGEDGVPLGDPLGAVDGRELIVGAGGGGILIPISNIWKVRTTSVSSVSTVVCTKSFFSG